MTLVPKGPLGRSTRKARAFTADIEQLRAQGYTFDAICEALAQAGVHVSISTVQREASRRKQTGLTTNEHCTAAPSDHTQNTAQTPAASELRVAPDSTSARLRHFDSPHDLVQWLKSRSGPT